MSIPPAATEPTRAIRSAIDEHGPITFARFMELALYGPGGFYELPPVGSHREFVTSPHVHPVFGDLVAAALRELWVGLDRPHPFPVVEVGAGDGTLARQLLTNLAGAPVAYTAVERSPGARAALAELPVRVEEGLEALGGLRRACVLANELLDNMPFRVVRRRGPDLVEVRVGREGDRLVRIEVEAEPPLADLAPELGPEEEAAVPEAALAFVESLAAALQPGYTLLIDYGEASGLPAGEVHGYRQHRLVEDVLREPGTADITAGVDFAAIMRRAEAAGLRALGLVSQRDALLALGLETWIRDERERQRRLLDSGEGLEAVKAWGARSRATLLADPTGPGRLRWLVLASPGLPAPEWLRRALAPSGPETPRPSTD